MAMGTIQTKGPANIDALLTTTREAILKSGPLLQDAVFNSIPVVRWLRKKTEEIKQGGASILVPLLYGKNATFKAYSADEVIDTTGTEGLTMAQATWRQYGGTVTLVGGEVRQNGAEKIMDLVKAKTQQALMSARDAIAIDLFASAQVAAKIHTFPVLVDATSTVQDINSTTSSWWQSQVVASGSFPGRGLADMRNLRDLIIQRGQESAPAPDGIFTTALVLELYEAGQVAALRYAPGDAADPSLKLRFSQATVEFDPNIATGELYMLPSEALRLCVHSDANFTLGEFKEPTDKDVRSAKLLWMGNLVTVNRRRLGKLTGITA